MIIVEALPKKCFFFIWFFQLFDLFWSGFAVLKPSKLDIGAMIPRTRSDRTESARAPSPKPSLSQIGEADETRDTRGSSVFFQDNSG